MDKYPQQTCECNYQGPSSPSQKFQGFHLYVDGVLQVHASGKAQIAGSAPARYEDPAEVPQKLRWNTMNQLHWA